jgi:hypothetical protein
MKKKDVDTAYAILNEMGVALDGMVLMMQRMAQAAQDCEATGLAFSANMMIEAVEAFHKEMTKFVNERIC